MARSVEAGTYSLLNVPIDEPEPDWHLDPKSGIRAPLGFGPWIDYRDPAVVGSAKNIWEKSRHQHLVLLALSAAVSEDAGQRRAVARHLVSWVTQNPVPRGINWCSSLELGVRLIAWIWIERLLRNTEEHERLFGSEGALRSSIYWHQWFIDRKPSHGSSANNHLIGEMAGLFMASLQWPAWRRSDKWQESSRDALEREIVRQTFPSGINREMGFAYHLFVVELFMLAGVEADRAGRPMSVRYRDQVGRMLDVIPRLSDVGGGLPTYGDSDDGMALWLAPDVGSRVDWILDVGSRWLGRSYFRHGQGATLGGDLLCPDRGVEPVGRPPSSGTEAFEDAGLFVMTAERGTSGEILCLVDAGPLGFLSIAGHGHCDALSFTVTVGGHPVLVDPGTYTYHDEVRWRDYFRSTAAHNTIRVDGREQSEPGGLFMYQTKAECRVSSWEAVDGVARLDAEHDGYARLESPVTHRRRVTLADRTLGVRDALEGVGDHLVEWFLQMHPSCDAEICGEVLEVSWPSGGLTVELDPRLSWSLEKGSDSGGWYSPSFNVREPAWTLRGHGACQLPFSMHTSIRVPSSAPVRPAR